MGEVSESSFRALKEDLEKTKAHVARLEKTLVKVLRNNDRLYTLLEKIADNLPRDLAEMEAPEEELSKESEN